MPTAKDKGATPRAPDKLALLRNHFLFRNLPPDVLDRLGSYMKRRTISRGAVIFAKGDPGTGLMGVLDRLGQDQRGLGRRPRRRAQHHP